MNKSLSKIDFKQACRLLVLVCLSAITPSILHATLLDSAPSVTDWSVDWSKEFLEEPELNASYEAIRRGDVAEGIRLVEALVAREPEHGLALEVLGTMRMERNRFHEAEQLLRRSAAVEERSSVIVKLGMSRIAMGKFEAGEADLHRALKQDPENLLAMQTLARLHAQREQFAAAISYYRRILESKAREPGNFTQVHIELAELYLQTGDADAVFKLTGPAIETQPQGAARNHALRLASAAALAAGDLRKAMAYAEELDHLLGADATISVTTAASALRALNRGDEAVQRLRQAMKTNPDPGIAQALGRLLLGKGDYAGAVAPLRAGLETTQDARMAESLVQDLAAALYRQGKLAEAVAIVSATAQRFPGNVGLGIAAASIIAASGNTSDALARLDEMVAEYPDYAELHFQKGQILMSTGGQHEQALAAFQRAAKLEPKRAELWVMLAELQANEGAEVVRGILERGLSFNPGSADLKYDLIALNEENKSRQDAISAYQALVQEHPGHFATLVRLATLLAEDSATRTQAKALLNQATEIHPDAPPLLAARAWMEHLSGESAAALQTLSVLIRDYGHPLVHYQIAAIHSSLGQDALARSAARTALAAGLTGLEREPALRLSR